MKARVGDRLIRDGGDGHRVCEIIALHHADGSPPYVVRWLSDGHIALLYPGPYMRLAHQHTGPPDGQSSERAAGQAPGQGRRGSTAQGSAASSGDGHGPAAESGAASGGAASTGAARSRAARGGAAAGEPAPGGAGKGKDKAGRPAAASPRWSGNPFLPRPLRGST